MPQRAKYKITQGQKFLGQSKKFKAEDHATKTHIGKKPGKLTQALTAIKAVCKVVNRSLTH